MKLKGTIEVNHIGINKYRTRHVYLKLGKGQPTISLPKRALKDLGIKLKWGQDREIVPVLVDIVKGTVERDNTPIN